MEDAHFCLPSYLLSLQSPLPDPRCSHWPQMAHPYCTSKIWMYLQEGDHTTGVILNPTFSLWLSTSTCCRNNSYQNGKLTRAQNLFSYLAQELPNAYNSFSNYHKPVLPQTVSSSKSMSKVGELPQTYLGTVFSWLNLKLLFPSKHARLLSKP